VRRSIGAVLLVSLALALFAACAEEREPWQPIGTLTVEVTGDDYHWYFDYPGRDGQLGTADDIRGPGPLHLPANTAVELQLRSVDYIYSLELPTLGLAEIAAPDLSYALQLVTAGPDRVPLRGGQFCGYQHEGLITELIIEDETAFREFIDATGR